MPKSIQHSTADKDTRSTPCAVAESEAKFRLLAESVPHMIWTIDRSGTIEYCNSRWYQYTGYSPDTPITVSDLEDAIHSDDRALFQEKWRKTHLTGEQYASEHRLRQSNGTYRWHMIRVLPLRDESGQIIKWCATCTDIDEQKRLDHKKDEFMIAASHELKTPLTTMKAFTQILHRQLTEKNDMTSANYLTKMNIQLEKLTQLVYDLLDVSRISAGNLELSHELFAFDECVSRVVEDMSSIIKSHSVVHTGSTGAWVYADQYRIEQVLINLVSNAVKYSPKGSVIDIRSSLLDNKVKVEVVDRGIGIPQDVHQHIFKQFYRVRSKSRDSYPGLGLGLYISSQIIMRHEGKIGVSSNEGNGSCFYFELPLNLEKQFMPQHTRV